MKANRHPLFLASLVLLTLGISAIDAFGLLFPFSKERIAAAGKPLRSRVWWKFWTSWNLLCWQCSRV